MVTGTLVVSPVVTKCLATCCNTAHTTYNQKRFTASELAADCHELMVLQCIMSLSILRTDENSWTCDAAHISHSSFPIPVRVGGWVGHSTHQFANDTNEIQTPILWCWTTLCLRRMDENWK